MNSNYRVIVTGGGTGGHYFPAQSIFSSLKNKGLHVKYIGSKFGIESNYCHNENPDSILLNIQGIQRRFTINGLQKNSLFPFKFISSYLKSRKIISQYKPHIVIGTGGYSSGLPLLAAIHLGIKTIIQEQNSFPGITTRSLSKKVNKVCIGFEEAKKYLPKNKVVLTGNPIRKELQLIDKIKAKNKFYLNPNKPVIAILGGSQGSKPFNNYFQKYFSNYTQSDLQLLWQCGKNDFDKLKKINANTNVHILPFSDKMNIFYSAADIVISRSGALALSEMAYLGKAMVLIPFPESAGNHQMINAKTFSKTGGAILIKQKSLNTNLFEKIIKDLAKNQKKISEMEKQSKRLGVSNATDNIVKLIIKMATI